jgi:hypothetical protein
MKSWRGWATLLCISHLDDIKWNGANNCHFHCKLGSHLLCNIYMNLFILKVVHRICVFRIGFFSSILQRQNILISIASEWWFRFYYCVLFSLYYRRLPCWQQVGQAWNGIGAICDISIALSMPYFVRNLVTLPYWCVCANIYTAHASRYWLTIHSYLDCQTCPSAHWNRWIYWYVQLVYPEPWYEIHTFPKSNYGHITRLSICLPQRMVCDTRTLHVENIRNYHACDFQ